MADILHHIEINSTAEVVFQAITTKNGLESWWTSDVQINSDPKKYVFGFGNHSILLVFEPISEIPNKHVSWRCLGNLEEWQNTELHFVIEKTKKLRTILKFKHSNWQSIDESYAKCNTDWGHLMYYLKDYVEGRNINPLMGQ